MGKRSDAILQIESDPDYQYAAVIWVRDWGGYATRFMRHDWTGEEANGPFDTKREALSSLKRDMRERARKLKARGGVR